ncbi:hypothetical protein BDZ89DRAFT_1054997 [Hymenopellis radicata]|nr:hypothetical protein BDZ89DRAFT_1054997 [Hymenopellis radicata]
MVVCSALSADHKSRLKLSPNDSRMTRVSQARRTGNDEVRYPSYLPEKKGALMGIVNGLELSHPEDKKPVDDDSEYNGVEGLAISGSGEVDGAVSESEYEDGGAGKSNEGAPIYEID